MSKFRDDDSRAERNETPGDRPPRRAERAGQEEDAPGRSFRREAKIGLSVLGVLLTSMGGVAGLRMTGKMPQMFAKKDAATAADDGGTKSAKPKLSSGPKYNAAADAKTARTKSAGAAATTVNGSPDGNAAAVDLSRAAELMDNAAAGNVPADPFASAGATQSDFANSPGLQAVDGEDPAAVSNENPWAQEAGQQGQALVDQAQGVAQQAVDTAVDAAAGMVDQARQALDASAQQYIDSNAPDAAGQYSQQAGQAYDQVADAVQQGANQAINQARDWAEQGSQWVQDQVADQQPAARGAVGAAQGDAWRGHEDQPAHVADSRAAPPIGDGQSWPSQSPGAGGSDDLAVDAASEPPLRIPSDPPAARDGYDRRAPAALDDREGYAQDGFDNRQDQRGGFDDRNDESRGATGRHAQNDLRSGNSPAADGQDPWANEPRGSQRDDRFADTSTDHAAQASRRNYEGYDSSHDLFPEGRGAGAAQVAHEPTGGETYTVQPDDNFWRISQRLYGTGAYFKALYEHNRAKFPRADHMRAGDVIDSPSAQVLAERYPDLVASSVRNRRAPAQPVAQSTRQDGRRVYIVQHGDTLFDIARAELGRAVRWAEIYELNRDVLGEDIENLQPGTELVLPGDAGRMSSRPYRPRR